MGLEDINKVPGKSQNSEHVKTSHTRKCQNREGKVKKGQVKPGNYTRINVVRS